MDSIYSVQSKLRQDLGLTKVIAVPNKNYKPHGTKSYVYLLNRFGFQPTKPGPYGHVNRIHQRGLANQKVAIGGRVSMKRVLVKKDGPDGEYQGEVTAEDIQNDSMYLCEVGIGEPAQTVRLDFDTGSSDLWVFSPKLDTRLQQNHNIYDPSKSSTFKASDDQTWQISYGDGSSASGEVGYDTVTIGGLKIQNQAVEMADKLADQFAQGTGDGLLGLAFPAINTIKKNGQPDPQNTPVANMISQEDIPKEAELFTSAFFSSRDQDTKSFYTFGYIDQDLVKSSGQDIVWTDIDNSQGFWMLPSTSATINGDKIALSGNKAIADTGTTLALVSDEVCEALYKQIPGAKYDAQKQGYVFPTTVTTDQLPEFSVAIGDNEFVIQKEDLAFAQADAQHWYGGVQSRGDNPFDILGDTFLKSVYAIWDQGNNRFGCVPKIEKTQNLGTSTSA